MSIQKKDVLDNPDLYIEIFGAVAGVAYVILQIAKRKIMWIVGMLTSSVYIYIFIKNGFYALAALNVYYVAMSIYGLWKWSVAPDICRTPKRTALFCLLFICLLFIVLTPILNHYTDAPLPWADALLSSMGVVATWMLARSYLEQWWVWIFANLLAVGVCAWQGLYPSSILFAAYTIAAVIGYRRWLNFCP
ncbi:MAG: nicotinamide riboside transporter PnuC [Prevotellaceae bacterium]|nr:nicotinamide riboside transporter PnuC [Prevotellaceae bacterium]